MKGTETFVMPISWHNCQLMWQLHMKQNPVIMYMYLIYHSYSINWNMPDTCCSPGKFSKRFPWFVWFEYTLKGVYAGPAGHWPHFMSIRFNKLSRWNYPIFIKTTVVTQNVVFLFLLSRETSFVFFFLSRITNATFRFLELELYYGLNHQGFSKFLIFFLA